MAVLTDEMVMTVKLGSTYDGTTPTFTGTTFDVMITLQDFDLSDELQKKDTRGAGSKRVRNRFFAGESKIELTQAVRMSGYNYKALAAATPVGNWVQITIKPLTTLSTADVYQGVIRVWRTRGSRGDMQLEALTVELDVDYGAAA